MKIISIDRPIGVDPGELSSREFKSQLPPSGEPVECRIHCDGGSVFEAFAMLDELTAHQGHKKAVVASTAFSAASLLLCGFDEVEITPNGYTMIHAPGYDDPDTATASQTQLLGNLRDRMTRTYAAKTGQPLAVIQRLIEEESYFDAEASVSLGLATRVTSVPGRAVAARYRHAIAMSKSVTATQQWRAAVNASAKSMSRDRAIVAVDHTHPGLRAKMLAEANGRPVAKAAPTAKVAAQQWRAAVDQAAKSMTRSRAVLAVERSHPGLRLKMIAEANAR